jgi:hypothetical protein
MVVALVVAAAVVGQSDPARSPRPAPKVYATSNYGLTFRSPPNLTYCPLPDGWVGSDHGTTLFMRPPRSCGDAGYPSSARQFAPSDTPRIEVYYEYAVQGWRPDATCGNAGWVRLLGKQRPLCLGREGRMLSLEAWAPYDPGAPAQVSVRLVTTRARLGRDVKTLRTLATSLHACNTSAAAPCPNAPWF